MNPPARLRTTLREATCDVHQRLHGHPGFAAIEARRISLPDYRALLTRLLGFYAPFEAAVGDGFERTDRLWADLTFLEALPSVDRTVPWCPHVPHVETAEQQIGALYVVEGAALGGQVLAGHLDGLLGVGDVRGRRFLHGRGAATGAAWLAFNARLEIFTHHGPIVSAAQETFETLERWLNGW